LHEASAISIDATAAVRVILAMQILSAIVSGSASESAPDRVWLCLAV
jgi:hypothetical protein